LEEFKKERKSNTKITMRLMSGKWVRLLILDG
jgi:hypothetical protein